jgi:hypothetical protein
MVVLGPRPYSRVAASAPGDPVVFIDAVDRDKVVVADQS